MGTVYYLRCNSNNAGSILNLTKDKHLKLTHSQTFIKNLVGRKICDPSRKYLTHKNVQAFITVLF